MVGSFLTFKGNTIETKTITLRDCPAWAEGQRSNDRDMVAAIYDILRQGHIAYAHNGDYFDMRWLRTVGLKYGLDMPTIRLVDPAQIAWRKYRLGKNSLEAIADFLELPYRKYHIPTEVWRRALLDDSDEDWNELKVRCESDVMLLNSVAGAVTGDAGMIDYHGSQRG
jgi:hypothetical protein